MVKTLKLNFTIPEDIAHELRTYVSKNKRSAFVSQALKSTLEELKRKQLEEELKEGYLARRKENEDLPREWGKATLENWPD